ncbi:molybdenum cofactor sulfurase [Gastrophryne carolinensis]
MASYKDSTPLEDLLSMAAFQKMCHPSEYGYGGTITDMRRKEFSRIGDMVYLDHAGTALFPGSLLQSFMADLSENVYGNPHSNNLSSRLTHDTIEHVRYRILQHFNTSAEDYSVIFTSGSTAALKLVADTFPWTPRGSDHAGSHFCYLSDNHTSVVGIRGIMKKLNIPYVPVIPEDLILSEERTNNVECNHHNIPHLFCFPALSNFSGTKYSLSWIEKVKSGKMKPVAEPGVWFVMLDAASFVSTSPLDLSTYKPDFVSISFYKIFGFPTGLGALIVSNEIVHLLRKSYFGGGTSAAHLLKEDFYVPKDSVSSRFEDGTISFLDIIALKHGFDVLQTLTGGMEKIRNHTHALAHYTYSVLSALRYANGKPVVQVYTDTELRTYDVQGPIINFNVLDENGGIIGYSQVDKMASLYNIHFRTGCFCNVGACQRMLGISDDEIKSNLQAGHICGDNMDMINGKPTGSIRISFGFMSTFEDTQVFLQFIIDTFLKRPPYFTKQPFDVEIFSSINLSQMMQEKQTIISDEKLTDSITPTKGCTFINEGTVACACKAKEMVKKNGKPITLRHIYIYPIKSCAAFQASQWPVGQQGLLFDRNWMIVNENGVCLSQKQEPKMCLIYPSIDLSQNVMKIQANGMMPIEIPLKNESKIAIQLCQSKVCGDRVHTYDCGEEIATWLSRFLGRRCRLIRQSSSFKRYSGANKKELVGATLPSLSLVNEAQYLLVNTASIRHLNQQIPLSDVTDYTEASHLNKMIQQFRANLVIDGNIPFEEEEWAEFFIGSLHFQISGKCSRCQIICIDQTTGEKKREILQTLSSFRKGKTTFGVYLLNSPCSSYTCLLTVGSEVSFTLKEIQHNS